MSKKSREHLKIYLPSVIIAILGFVIAYQFVQPAPPREITIATGDEKGAYHAFGLRYRDILARNGIALKVKSTAGSVENIKLLDAPGSGVDVAFVQGGVGNPDSSPVLTSLASLYFEPLWVFHRSEMRLARLTDLRGKRIAVGPEKSGTRAIALQLLADNALDDREASLLSVGGEKAVELLRQGEVDAAFFVASARSSLVHGLLERTDVSVMSFENAEAYRRIHRFLSRVTLPQGVINFGSNIPPRDVELIAPAATLVSRDDLHPALIELILQAAAEVHGKGDLFEEPSEFPSQKYLDFPIHKEARRHFKSGPPFLQRYLPFWAASLIDRLKIMLLPLITLLIPLFKIVPPTYRWRVRSRITHWYKELQAVDSETGQGESAERDKCLAEIDRIDRDVRRVIVPTSYAAELYALQLHIAHVRKRIEEMRQLAP
jgi:TRAP transporter TAXI family solute receptor